MRILVTAGSTTVAIDKVRVISNIFGGITGTRIAKYCGERGDEVTLLTSNPELAEREITAGQVAVRRFRSYDNLAERFENEVRRGEYDAIVHSAAVSDFKVDTIRADNGSDLELPDPETIGKLSSRSKRLILELVPTVKLINQIRGPWGFAGVLVKFKLEVGLTDEQLLQRASCSLVESQADLVVANCLEWSSSRAFILLADATHDARGVEVARSKLPERLYELIRQRSAMRLLKERREP